MTLTNTGSLESRLTTFLNELVLSQIISDFPKYPKPLCSTVKRNNAYYARILIGVCTEGEPRYEHIASLGFGNSDDAYQNAIYLYRKWRSGGIVFAVANYCQIMNKLIHLVITKKGGKTESHIIGIGKRSQEILDFIDCLFGECRKIENIKKLALNY